MGERDWIRAVVTGLAATHVAGLVAGHVLPWTGSLTMLAFLLFSATAPGARAANVAGVGALAALALCVDARTGGRGFPNALLDLTDPGRRAVEGGLIVLGLAALAVAALPRPRYAALAVVAFLTVLAAPLLHAWSEPRTEASLQQVMNAEDRERLFARAREAANAQRGEIVAIAVARGPAPPGPVEPPDWSLGLLPAAPAAAIFAALAFLATGRESEDYIRP